MHIFIFRSSHQIFKLYDNQIIQSTLNVHHYKNIGAKNIKTRCTLKDVEDTFNRMRARNHGAFGDEFVLIECALDFGGAEQVAANVEHVVDAARHPAIAFGVDPRAIARHVVP